MNKRHNWVVGILAALSLAPLALAEAVKPTVSGTLERVSGNQVVLRSELGTIWRGELQPNGRCEWNGSSRSLSSIPKGSKVVMRVIGSLTDKPLKVDLVSDWMNSDRLVAKAAPVPYHTRQGDQVVPGGVAGNAPNAPNLGKAPNVGAYALNGANPAPYMGPTVPNITAPAAQDPGRAQLPTGVPGLQVGPAPAPAPGPGSAPAPAPQAAGPYPGANPYATNPYSPAPMQPAVPDAYNGMPYNPTMATYPGMNTNFPGQSSMGLESLLNGSEEGGGDMQQGGPMMPMNSMSMGMPVQMQATVLRADPATRSLVVQQMGTQIPQNIVVNPQVMMPALRQGQVVMISGSSSPQGFIEAQQITPLGP